VTVLTTPRGHRGGAPRGDVLLLGAVSYLNVAPIIYGLADYPDFHILQEVPSRIAERLHGEEIHLGTIPSIEYAFGDYAIVPGIAIASRGPVRSVCLYFDGPLDSVKRVALDTSSRTSAALVKILLRERLGEDPEYVPMSPSLDDMLEAADAALLIGDPALYATSDVPRLDLGEEWTKATGLPFVYAFWAGRPGVLGHEDVERLQESLRRGLRAIPEIAARYEPGRGREDVSGAYLRENIVFSLGEEEKAGLALFYRRAHALGLIPRVPELRFHA